MKAPSWAGPCLHWPYRLLFRTLIVAGFLLCAQHGWAQTSPGGSTTNTVTYTPLDTWTFYDNTNWTSDLGYAPISFTNLAYSYLGNGHCLVVDTNIPARIHYPLQEPNGTTNFTPASGTVTFWYAPGSWSSTNIGGTGPGDWGRLFQAGSYTANSDFGWWSIYLDAGGNTLYFSTQTNDLSGSVSTYIAYPISWTTNYFHFIALTYSPTNTALYLDGSLATNGPALTIYPGPEALTNGFYIGSDSSGTLQAHGLFNSVATYDVPLDASSIESMFNNGYIYYMMNPWNRAMFQLASAPSSPGTGWDNSYNAITGQGNLSYIGSVPNCVAGTNVYDVWITNLTVSAASSGGMTVTFSIAGGASGAFYDVFANSILGMGTNSVPWAWLGQGATCNTYQVTVASSHNAFIVLGTPLDSDGDGLTDAYEELVSHTNPYNPDTDGDGISDGTEVLNGSNPLSPNSAIPLAPAIQTCP